MAARRVVDRFGDPGSAPGAAGGEAGAGGGADEWDDFTNASPWEELQRDVEQVLLAWGLRNRGAVTCVAETVPGGMPAPESSGGGAGGLGGRGVSWPTSSGTMDGIHGGKIRWKSVEMTSGGGRGSRAGRGDDSSRAKASDDSGTPGRRL